MRVTTTTRTWALVVVVAVLAVACGSDDLDAAPQRGGYFPDLYDPTREGEPIPDGYRESVPRDAILPVYEPSFVAPTEVDWPADELVIGVEIGGEARAYPVGFLTWREIVVDTHRGIPTLVTW